MRDSNEKSAYGAIILAAGASARMGCVKQTLPWKNTTLLQHVVNEIRSSGIDELVVVLGANKEEIELRIEFEGVHSVFNDQWGQGMASSIVAGLKHLLLEAPEMRGVLIALSDQPLLDKSDFKNLVNKHLDTKGKIISSYYEGGPGVPVLFDRVYFNDLLDLSGERGARVLLREHKSDVIQVDVGDRGIDLDTRDKYDRIYDLYGRP